jgi:glycosyltransferase involved in cell wall biosynthesis
LDAPRVSVILAARDEAPRVAETIRRLLQQRGVALEIIAVNDRSTDGTGEIVDRLAAGESRVRVEHVRELPAGWLGKCHALSVGARHATADWLLFTDADVHICDDLIRRAVDAAERDAADHLTLFPGLSTRGLVTRGCLLAFSQLFSLYAPVTQINRDRGQRGLGVGAFNLVRRAAYTRIGGHETLRLEVLDDVKLGQLIRRAGLRQRVYSGMSELEAEWADELWGLIRSIEKNWFAGVYYNVFGAAASIVALLGLWLGAVLAPWWCGANGWWAVAAVFGPALPAVRLARLMRWPRYAALLAPLGYPVFALAGVNSTLRTLLRGGVRWRDTFYTLAELRAGQVR